MNFKKYWQAGKNMLGLSLAIAKAEFKLKNEGSYLGILWYLLNPILMFVLMFFIFHDRVGVRIAYYALYLFLGIIMFNFFQSSTVESTQAIIKDYFSLIKSIHFPTEALILSIIIKNFFSHLFEILIFLALIIYFKIELINIMYYIPIVLFFMIFTFGLSLLLSSLTIYFTDLYGIWNFSIKLIWLLTPIFYEIGGQNRLFYLNLANPVYYFITISRDLIIYNQLPSMWLLLGALLYSIGFLILGLAVFNKLKKKFAELI